MESSPMIHNDKKRRGDIPYDGKTNQFNTKKDQVLLFISGLENNWDYEKKPDCLTSAFVGVKQETTLPLDDEHYEGIALSHIYW